MSELLRIAKENGARINDYYMEINYIVFDHDLQLLATINAYNATQPAKIPDDVLAYIASVETSLKEFDGTIMLGHGRTYCNKNFEHILASKPESLK